MIKFIFSLFLTLIINITLIQYAVAGGVFTPITPAQCIEKRTQEFNSHVQNLVTGLSESLERDFKENGSLEVVVYHSYSENECQAAAEILMKSGWKVDFYQELAEGTNIYTGNWVFDISQL